MEAGGTLENPQAMAAHESPRTTKLYDRTGDEITLDEVERIRFERNSQAMYDMAVKQGRTVINMKRDWTKNFAFDG